MDGEHPKMEFISITTIHLGHEAILGHDRVMCNCSRQFLPNFKFILKLG